MTDEQILSLIGRTSRPIDYEGLNKFYKGRVVLVTGGAGSIGSELVGVLLGLETRLVIAVDFNEFGIFSLPEHIKLIKKLGDLKTDVLIRILRQYRPDIVIHASAYKHVPLLQENPLEAYNNNVWGSYHTINLCEKFGVEHFVLVSTDKAVNTTNVMGATKRLCEMFVENETKMVKNAVRFGNVIRSKGSAINTFISQIESGVPVTVTHPRIMRYFMTVNEAVGLILQSPISARDGDIYLLDMGEPVKIVELVHSLIREYRSDSKIEFIGLRKGEKLFEELSFDSATMEIVGNMYRITNFPEKRKKSIIKSAIRLFKKTMNYRLSNSELTMRLYKMGFSIK